MTKPLPKGGGKRKTSARPLKRDGKLKHPKASAAFKKLWADPEWREMMVQKRRDQAARRTPFNHNGRRGVPDGMRKADADALWAEARRKAQEFHQIMVDKGDVEAIVTEDVVVARDEQTGEELIIAVPVSDAQKASSALREAMVMALSPLSHAQTKVQAIRTILEYTKSKPAQKTDLRVNNAEAWLNEVLKDDDGDTGETSTSP